MSYLMANSKYNVMEQRTFLEQTYSIVVNWNLPRDTIESVQSLFDAGAMHGHVIVVDNGSADDSVERLRSRFGDQIQLLESNENLGFAGGNNWAIEHALAQGAGWILLANNDTLVASTFFSELANATRHHPDYSLIAPLILYHERVNDEECVHDEERGHDEQKSAEIIWSLGDRLVPGTLATRGLFRNQPVPEELAAFVEVDFLNACGLLIRRDVFEQIGVFDLSYFMYAEDVDLCWRANLAGFKLGCATRARMWHKVTRSTGVNHPSYRYWSISNQIRFYRQYATIWQRPIMFCFTILHGFRTILLDILAGRFRIAQTVVRAWFDGWFRNSTAKV